jgi:tripartite-type tricarboxylate transporter receptor subunit TctC
VGEALRSNDMRDKLAAAGLEAQPGSAADMAAYLQREVAKWGKIVKDTGVTQ